MCNVHWIAGRSRSTFLDLPLTNVLAPSSWVVCDAQT